MSRRPVPGAPRAGGAALIAALLTVALATVLATQLVTAQSAAIRHLAGRQDLAQARWLARGAADWARAILSEDARTSRIDHLGEAWAIKVPPIPLKSGRNQEIAEGELSGEIGELDGRFNLNRLQRAAPADRSQLEVFVRLLILLGSATTDAERLALTLADWIDADNETADGADETGRYGGGLDNRPLQGVGTLLRVPGFTPALVARLQPFVCVLPQRSPLNLNTAPAEVLAAELPAIGLALAQRAVADRERAPFLDPADFNARVSGATAGVGFGVASSYFVVTTRASYGDSVVQLRTLLYRSSAGKWPDILWQQQL